MAAADEEELSGGNVNRVVRIGDTVRRTVGPWSSGVHALLRHVRAQGFDGAPAFLGMDEAGRETLTFMAGEVAGNRYPNLPRFMWSDDTLEALALLLRRYHDATQGFASPATAAWQLSYRDAGRHEVMCHNDAALYNVVFRDEVPVALIDFDMASPGPRLWDIAYTIYTSIPLASFAPDDSTGVLAAYSKNPHAAERRRRLALFFAAYGMEAPCDLKDWVIDRLRASCDTLRTRAAEGDPAFRKMVDEGHLAHYEREVDFLGNHCTDWT